LYRLILRRFIASQMKPALYDTVTVDIETLIQASPTVYLFRASGSSLRFAGFLKVYGVDADAEEGRPGEPAETGLENEKLPDLAAGDPLTLHQLVPKQHFTQPPPRYTEAQLIGALKKLGLGRPSTYATIVETLKERKYAGLEQKRLYPTPLGFQVCELLERHIQIVVDIGFTARMEEDLDRLARGEIDRLTMMRAFYGPFKATVDQALAGAAAERQPAARTPTKSGAGKRQPAKPLPQSERQGQACPHCCEGSLEVKSGKFGPFLGCSRYAQGCHYTENLPNAGSRQKRRPRRHRKS
jgi:DNA topoisomerase-1